MDFVELIFSWLVALTTVGRGFSLSSYGSNSRITANEPLFSKLDRLAFPGATTKMGGAGGSCNSIDCGLITELLTGAGVAGVVTFEGDARGIASADDNRLTGSV